MKIILRTCSWVYCLTEEASCYVDKGCGRGALGPNIPLLDTLSRVKSWRAWGL